MPKKVCIRGKDCPYQHEHQHASEYSHDAQVKKKKRKQNITSGRKRGGRKLGGTGRKRIGSNGGVGNSTTTTMWSCNYCTFSNTNNSRKCSMCDKARAIPTKRRKKVKRRRKDTSWACSFCTVINMDERSSCSVCGRKRDVVKEDVIDLCGSDEEDVGKQRSSKRRRKNTLTTSNSLDRKLKAEQDDAFELARAIDLSKAQQKEREREEKEKKERMRRAKEESHQEEINRKRKEIGEEPTDGSLVSVMFKLPDNTRIQRKFRHIDRIQKMYFFLDITLSAKGIRRYSTKIPPERPVNRDAAELEKTFKDLGLCGRVAVFVFDLDA